MGKNARKPLTPEERAAILAILKQAVPTKKIAAQFNVCVNTVQRIGRDAHIWNLHGGGYGPGGFCVGEEASEAEIEEVAARKAEVDAMRQKGHKPDSSRPPGHISRYMPPVYPDPRPMEDIDRDSWWDSILDSDAIDEAAIEGEGDAPRSWQAEDDPMGWLFDR